MADQTPATAIEEATPAEEVETTDEQHSKKASSQTESGTATALHACPQSGSKSRRRARIKVDGFTLVSRAIMAVGSFSGKMMRSLGKKLRC